MFSCHVANFLAWLKTKSLLAWNQIYNHFNSGCVWSTYFYFLPGWSQFVVKDNSNPLTHELRKFSLLGPKNIVFLGGMSFFKSTHPNAISLFKFLLKDSQWVLFHSILLFGNWMYLASFSISFFSSVFSGWNFEALTNFLRRPWTPLRQTSGWSW